MVSANSVECCPSLAGLFEGWWFHSDTGKIPALRGRLSIHLRSQESKGSKWSASSSLAVPVVGFLDRSLPLHNLSASWCMGNWGLSWARLYSRSKAALRLRSGGIIWLSTGSHSVGVDLSVPLIILMVSFSCTSTFCVWALLSQIGAPYSAAE